MTIEEKIEEALYVHVAALAALDGMPSIAWPNDAFPVPPETKPGTYIELRLMPNDNTRLFLNGGAPHMRQGILQLTVFTPLLVGSAPATALAGEIAEFFPADLDLFNDGVRVRIQQAPDVLPGDKDDVSWMVPISIRYEAFA